MKPLIFFVLLLLSVTADAQLLSFGSSAVTIKSGTTVVIENLTLIPSADISISNNTLTKATTIVHSSSMPYISRVYQFTATTPAFSGSVQINYLDNELNGIPENQLTLNVHNGITWSAYPATTRDPAINFVLTNNVSSALNELTLANLSGPLPLTWLSFTAIKQEHFAFLKWTTITEQNTRNFTIQHSADGLNWNSLGSLSAAGNSTGNTNYSYKHISPLTAINYYRILQTDLDNRYSYSSIQKLRFTGNDEPFIIFNNPVTNNVLTMQINNATILGLYTADGKLLWQENVKAGNKTFNLSPYAKGTYLLKSANTAQKLVVQ